MNRDSWEQDRQLRAKLSAIEVTKGIGDEWYEQRERLYRFYDIVGSSPRVNTRTVEGADTLHSEARMCPESDGDHRPITRSITTTVSGSGVRGDD